MAQAVNQTREGPWDKELDDLARAFSGAFIFGMPLLFTMEMWWIGTFAELWKLLLMLAMALGVNVMLAYFAGFRRENTLGDNINQAVEAVAVGAVASTVVLLVLNRIALGDPLDSILGKIIIQALPLSIGASVANAVFSRGGGNQAGGQEENNQENSGKRQKSNPWRVTLSDLGTTIGGAMFLSFSVAPTEEIPMLAAEIGYGHELALIGLTLLLTYIIVFESGFSPQQSGGNNHGPFQRPITETILAYIVALLVALAALLLFDQVEIGEPLASVISKTLVLGLPAAIGGAAGRVLISSAATGTSGNAP